MDSFLATLAMLAGMGLAGSLHCAGMCGAFAALATGRRTGRLLAYLAGKTGAYIFLGALTGAAGHSLLALDIGRGALAVFAGFVLLLAGLDALGLIRMATPPLDFARPIAHLGGEGASGALLIGSANGLLPCPMTLGFLAMAGRSASPFWGAATMLVLALTSAVPLALCGLAGYRLGRWRRFPAQRVAGVLMLALAAFSIYRGLA